MPMQSLAGRWYATGPEDREFAVTDPDVAVYRVISDNSDIPGCVLAQAPAGDRFAVARSLVAEISRPACELEATI